MNQKQKMVIGIGSGVVALSALIFVFFYGVYGAQWEAKWFRSVAGGLPVASVDGQSIHYGDYLTFVDTGRAFLASPAAAAENIPPDFSTEMKKASYERAIRINMIRQFSQQEGITLSTQETDKAFEQFIMQSDASSTREQAVAELGTYFGWTESEFKDQVMQPALLEDLLFKKFEAQGKTQADFEAMINDRLSDAHVKRYLKF